MDVAYEINKKLSEVMDVIFYVSLLRRLVYIMIWTLQSSFCTFFYLKLSFQLNICRKHRKGKRDLPQKQIKVFVKMF